MATHTMEEKYKTLKVADLRAILVSRGCTDDVAKLKKQELIDKMLEMDEQDAAAEAKAPAQMEPADMPTDVQPEQTEKELPQEEAAGEENRESGKKRKGKRGKSGDLDSGETANGILEVLADGYGFIRSDNYMPGDEDIYVAPSQIRKFALQTGDVIEGKIRVRNQNEKFAALLCLTKVNGVDPEKIPSRRRFEDMTPVFPDKRLRLERGRESIAVRLVDIVSPIGKGQRGMIVSPPKAGKTTLLKQVALSVLRNNPEMHIIILLIDERPEEVTDMKESIQGEQVEVPRGWSNREGTS